MEDAYAGIDVAFAKKKRLPVVVVVKRGAVLEPLPLRSAKAFPPAGEGNARILNDPTVKLFAQQVFDYLRDVEKEFGVRIRCVAIDAPKQPLKEGKQRRECEKGLDARRISCITTPTMETFSDILKRGKVHLRKGNPETKLPGANQLWMLVGFALFAKLKQSWECIEVFPQAIVSMLNAHRIPKSQDAGLLAQFKAISRHTFWPSSPNPNYLAPIAYGARHDKLDAYMSAWVASLAKKDRESIGQPPNDVIWVPRLPIQKTGSRGTAVTPVSSLSGADSFPVYKQLLNDNSCGPRCILMVADYFEKVRGRKLFAHEWSRVLEVTMENDLVRDRGTSWEDMVFGLSEIGLSCRRIRGATPEAARKAMARALGRNHPVIVSCLISYRGKPVRHYAVLVAMDGEFLYFADPFPHKDCPAGSLRPVPWSEFLAGQWSKGVTVWGKGHWAVEVSFTPRREG
jgi:hypothetical protein